MEFNPRIPYNVPPIKSSQLKDIQEAIADDLMKAREAIAQIRGFLSGLPGTQYALMNPIFLKEAVESSEIENINTTLLEVLQRQVAPKPDDKTSSQLVVNYIIATQWGIEHVKQLGLTNRLIKGIQHQLLPSASGEYRRVPVVIGDGRGKVHYTPPNAQEIPGLIGDWEKLVNNNSKIDPLVLSAAGHYQFESIHPFEDGNGRTGRMLMTLHLMEAGLLSAPVIHISQYINVNKGRYYRLLRNVTSKGELEQFVRYIVKGFAQQADHSYTLLQRIQNLQVGYQQAIKQEFPNIYSHEFVEAIFVRAVQTPVQLAKDLNIHYVTASKYLKKIKQADFVKVRKLGRHTYYVNHRLLELIEQKSPMEIEKELEV